MKKIFITGLILVGLTSCSKTYTCKCTSAFDDGSTLIQTQDYANTTKEQATNNCQSKADDIAKANASAGFISKVNWALSIK